MTENTNPTTLNDLTDAERTFILAFRRMPTEPAAASDPLTDVSDEPAENSAPAEKPAPADKPMSWQMRQRFRNRRITPDIRFRMLGMLEEIRDLINDTACSVASERYGGDRVGIFEEDAIADQLIKGLSDFLSFAPNINQLASEYHVRWFYDIEYDYSRKTEIAYAADGRTIQARNVLGEPDKWDAVQMAAAKQDAESQR